MPAHANPQPTHDLWENPLGTDGFEFVVYTAPDPTDLALLFNKLGFRKIAQHKTKKLDLYRQGDINFILSSQPNTQAEEFAKVHGPSVCAMAFRVKDAEYAYKRALELGAEPFEGSIREGDIDTAGDKRHWRQRAVFCR